MMHNMAGSFTIPVLCLLQCLIGAEAWLQAYNAEQQRYLKSVVYSKPQTFEDIRNRRIKAEKDGTSIRLQENADSDDGRVLDGFFLVNSATTSVRITKWTNIFSCYGSFWTSLAFVCLVCVL